MVRNVSEPVNVHSVLHHKNKKVTSSVTSRTYALFFFVNSARRFAFTRSCAFLCFLFTMRFFLFILFFTPLVDNIAIALDHSLNFSKLLEFWNDHCKVLIQHFQSLVF